MASTPDGNGYWWWPPTVASSASATPVSTGRPAISDLDHPSWAWPRPPTATATGWWLRTGGVFSFGDAGFYGSAGGLHLRQTIVGMASTPDGHGYWLVASDGGVFSFGDAGFYGSVGGLHLRRSIVAMAPSPDGHGYWLVASDGGVFSYGDAGFYGSAGSSALRRPIVVWPPPPTATATGWWPPTAASSATATPSTTGRGPRSPSPGPSWGWRRVDLPARTLVAVNAPGSRRSHGRSCDRTSRPRPSGPAAGSARRGSLNSS